MKYNPLPPTEKWVSSNISHNPTLDGRTMLFAAWTHHISHHNVTYAFSCSRQLHECNIASLLTFQTPS